MCFWASCGWVSVLLQLCPGLSRFIQHKSEQMARLTCPVYSLSVSQCVACPCEWHDCSHVSAFVGNEGWTYSQVFVRYLSLLLVFQWNLAYKIMGITFLMTFNGSRCETCIYKTMLSTLISSKGGSIFRKHLKRGCSIISGCVVMGQRGFH